MSKTPRFYEESKAQKVLFTNYKRNVVLGEIIKFGLLSKVAIKVGEEIIPLNNDTVEAFAQISKEGMGNIGRFMLAGAIGNLSYILTRPATHCVYIQMKDHKILLILCDQSYYRDITIRCKERHTNAPSDQELQNIINNSK